MKKFRVNEAWFATGVHVAGRVFRKGEVYDPVEMRMSPGRYQEMMSMNLKGLYFFEAMEEEEKS